MTVQSPPGLAGAIVELKRLELDQPGVIIEEKPGGVAVHYRQAPGAEATCREMAERIAADTGMALQPGKMVVELKHPVTDKGKAMKRFMEAPPFVGTLPVFIGDDLTDEDGFESARELGGAGVARRFRTPDPTRSIVSTTSPPCSAGWRLQASSFHDFPGTLADRKIAR